MVLWFALFLVFFTLIDAITEEVENFEKYTNTNNNYVPISLQTTETINYYMSNIPAYS